MTDRELLELAAKGAGYVLGRHTQKDAFTLGGREWNPLTDDGDALRLAVRLNLTSVFHPVLHQALVREYHDKTREWVEDGEKHPDPYAATRRAIVRAAAEIGRATNEPKQRRAA